MKKPLFWITGNYFECRSAISSIVEKFKNNREVIVDGATGAETIISTLVGNDVFENNNKIIRVKDVPENHKELVPYLKIVKDNRVLIIEVPSYRHSKLSNSEILKYFKKNGCVLKFPEILEDASPWIKNVVENYFKKTIDSDAAHLLSFMKNGNLDLIYSEIDKLSDFLGSRRKITVDDVKECCYSNIEFDVWKLIDLLTSSIYLGCDESIVALEKYFCKYNIFKEIEMLMGAIMMRFEMLLFARECGKEIVFNEVKDKVASFKKVSENELKDRYSDGFLRMFCYSPIVKKAVSCSNLGHLINFMCLVYFVGTSIRANGSDVNFVKLILTLMFETIGGRMSIPDFYNLFPSRNKLICYVEV